MDASWVGRIGGEEADVGIQSHFPNQITITHQNDWVFMIDKSLFLIGIMIVIAAIIANHATNLEMCYIAFVSGGFHRLICLIQVCQWSHYKLIWQ